MKYIVIINEKAGAAAKGCAEASPAALREAFASVGVEADVHVIAPDKIINLLHDAIAMRPDAVIIGGGDGTVRSAAAALVDTGVALGVLPLGTLNHFAKDLRIPLGIKDAVAALAHGAVRDVDVGEVNEHIFINNCSLGAYAEAVRGRDALRAEYPKGKWWAMLQASFATFRRLRRMRLSITLAGAQPFSVRTPVVLVANNRYSGHFLNQSLRARLDGGQLWIYTAHVHRHLAVLRFMLQSLVRRLDAADDLAAESASELVIENKGGPLPVAADGELVDLQSPLRFRIRPQALRVLVPREEETVNP